MTRRPGDPRVRLWRDWTCRSLSPRPWSWQLRFLPDRLSIQQSNGLSVNVLPAPSSVRRAAESHHQVASQVHHGRPYPLSTPFLLPDDPLLRLLGLDLQGSSFEAALTLRADPLRILVLIPAFLQRLLPRFRLWMVFRSTAFDYHGCVLRVALPDVIFKDTISPRSCLTHPGPCNFSKGIGLPPLAMGLRACSSFLINPWSDMHRDHTDAVCMA